jgi:hypothetical protein
VAIHKEEVAAVFAVTLPGGLPVAEHVCSAGLRINRRSLISTACALVASRPM